MPPAMKTVYIDCIDLWPRCCSMSLVAHFMAISIGSLHQQKRLNCNAVPFAKCRAILQHFKAALRQKAIHRPTRANSQGL